MRAQAVSVKTDKNDILIGERFEYNLLLSLPAQGYKVSFKIPDSIPHFDIIENTNFDTINHNGDFSIHKKIVFTSFDSGAWHIPSFEILLNQNNVSTKLNTDSLLVNVGYSPPDSSNQLRDIKPVMEVTVTDYFWYHIAGGILVLIIIALVIYFYLKNRKKKPAPVFHSALSAFDEAMKSLQEIKQHDLDKPEQVKIFHVTLADIFKKYYSRKQSRNLMNKTTGDILISVKEQLADPALVFSIAGSLRLADAVKFAKYIPGISESNKSHSQIKESIEQIEKDQSQQKQ